MNQQELLKLFALANEFKEGDLLVGGTKDEAVRKDARLVLSGLSIREISKISFVEDGVSEALDRSLDRKLFSEILDLTIFQLKSILLGSGGSAWAHQYMNGLKSEVIAAVVKVMTNDELALVAQSIFNPISEKGITIGSEYHFGSRIQPNSPGDEEEEILFSILEGLTYGCGDVILGLNPASDDVDTIVRLEKLLKDVVDRLELPTRFCVLSDIVKQTRARERTRIDVGFQSLAGTSMALEGMVGLDAEGLLDLARGFEGLYFETGQGSAVTNGAAQGVDMVTLEARNYGLARWIRAQTGRWMIVNDVAGFIGPEVFKTMDQLLRACLEDSVMAKLHGITMGLDVCSTFHMGIEPEALEKLTVQIVEKAAPAYLMAVAGNADPMLGYMTTSFREHPRLRKRTGRKISTVMQNRMMALGITKANGDLEGHRPRAESLYALYLKAGGDKRSVESLRDEGLRKLSVIQERGFDLGFGDGSQDSPPVVRKRMDAIYKNACRALYAVLDDSIINDVAKKNLRVHTNAVNREDYLAHPSSGELICDEDTKKILGLYQTRKPQVQLVISDGLNANAINENLHDLRPLLGKQFSETGLHVGDCDIVVENGRVRAGYHIGALLDVDIVIHLIGERPGTGLNTLSAYLTFGRDRFGKSRWSPNLDHSLTTAVCGIHRKGKLPEVAAVEIVECVKRIIKECCSGVELVRGKRN